MTCPHCNADLTPGQVRTLQQQLNSSRVRNRSGGKVWRQHKLNADGSDYSRCRCAQCHARRLRPHLEFLKRFPRY